MLKPRPRSFRRILLLRLLLIGIPILLVGQYVTVRKGRTSLLETARQNLTSSAIRKADLLDQTLQLLQGNLQTLTQTQALQSGEGSAIAAQLEQFRTRLPGENTCLQINQAVTAEILQNTCETPWDLPLAQLPWTPAATTPAPQSSFYLLSVGDPRINAPATAPTVPDATTESETASSNLEIALAAPVYTSAGELRYTVSLRTQVSLSDDINARSLVGRTIVINQAGTILAHPDPSLLARSVDDLESNDRIKSILRNIEAGNSDTLHLFGFMPHYPEWLAGYTPMQVETAPGQSERWAVLAATPLDNALHGLTEIRDVLILFTLGLLAAQVLLILYLANRLSRPAERLCAYAQEIQDLSQAKNMPHNFWVWEFDHLAKVLSRMMERLEQRARELEHAWQQAQMANQLKSEFLANTSHELRTPLNGIIGFIRLVKDDCCDSEEEKQEFLERADQAAIHLLGIINDILDIAKIESGTLALQLEPLDIQQIIEEAVSLQIVHAQQKGITLRQPELTEPLWAIADHSKLKQVLLNVIYNAVKFTEAGEITVAVAVQQTASTPCPLLPSGMVLTTPFPRVVISVQDTGIGIDPKQQEKLFQPFVMVDGSTTRRFQGTGLGLAISRNLMNLMEGSIDLYSEGIGQGTQVILALPLLPQEEHAQQTAQHRTADDHASATTSAPSAHPPSSTLTSSLRS